MNESIPSSVQPVHAPQNPAICERLSGVRRLVGLACSVVGLILRLRLIRLSDRSEFAYATSKIIYNIVMRATRRSPLSGALPASLSFAERGSTPRMIVETFRTAI